MPPLYYLRQLPHTVFGVMVMNGVLLLQQTLFLSGSHFFVRVIGFVMRIWLSRELGPSAMGLVELAHSAQMLLITPVISGLPAAVSRLSAKAGGDKALQTQILRCGMTLSLAAGIPLAALAFFLREPLALWLGDLRTLPALIVYLPCIPILGISCVLNGYFYGTGRPMPPALGEILEQLVRFFLCVRLVSLLKSWPMPLRAAIPALGTLAGETISLFLMLAFCLSTVCAACGGHAKGPLRKEMLALALPLTGMKLVSSLMRTVNAALIPARLQHSGLPAGEALSRLGMLNGMVMPMLMLPSFVTGSLCMICAPEITRRQTMRRPLRRICQRLLLAALGIGLMAMAAVWAFAPLLANTLYRQAELLPILRRSCAMIPMLSLLQVANGIMNGFGLQRVSLRISLAGSLLGVVLTYALTAQAPLRLWGALIAMAAAQALQTALTLLALRRHIARHCA